jgi:hypothetical protein
MDEQDAFWRQAYDSFKGHAAPFKRWDRDSQAALTRVAIKGLGMDTSNCRHFSQRNGLRLPKAVKFDGWK